MKFLTNVVVAGLSSVLALGLLSSPLSLSQAQAQSTSTKGLLQCPPNGSKEYIVEESKVVNINKVILSCDEQGGKYVDFSLEQEVVGTLYYKSGNNDINKPNHFSLKTTYTRKQLIALLNKFVKTN